MGEIIGGILGVLLLVWFFGTQAKDLVNSFRALFSRSKGEAANRISDDTE